MLTSKEIIERTGISRATLNNYIAAGLVARPDVLPPGPEHGDAPRIGYFPDDTLARIETIQRLKREGWTMSRIAEHLSRGGALESPGARSVPTPAAAALAVQPQRAERSAPVLATLAIAVGTLDDAAGLWSRLSAHEYFELANEVWAELEAIFRAHKGLLGRHPDEGLVSYFRREAGDGHLAAAIAATHAARGALHALDRRWQERKRWDVRVAMNFGIDEGEVWTGAIGADELRVLGEPAERAAQLSRCAPTGSILATRSLIGKLPADLRQRMPYAAPRPPAGGDAGPRHTFERLGRICPHAPARLADVAVAEILDLAGPSQAAPE